MSTDEQMLLFVAVGYVLALTLWVLSLQARARTMFRLLSELVEPQLWQALGAPESISEVMRDSERRWVRFVRSGEYRRQCDDIAIALIDDYRKRTKLMLAVLAVGGLLLMVRFWPLLKPDFL